MLRAVIEKITARQAYCGLRMADNLSQGGTLYDRASGKGRSRGSEPPSESASISEGRVRVSPCALSIRTCCCTLSVSALSGGRRQASSRALEPPDHRTRIGTRLCRCCKSFITRQRAPDTDPAAITQDHSALQFIESIESAVPDAGRH